MPNDEKETLVDQWTRRVKNQRFLAVLILLSGAVIGVASFTDSITKLAHLVTGHESSSETKELRPDYSHHPLLWDPALLHPQLRQKVEELRKSAAKENINLQYYEVYRSPSIQREMFHSHTTFADAWQSLKQYGLAATLLPYGSTGWIENPPEGTVTHLAALAITVGLRQEGTRGIYVPLTFVLPNTKIDDLQKGNYPAGGDQSWALNLNNQIEVWGSQAPPAPSKITLR